MIFLPIGILIVSIISFVIGNKQWKSGTVVTVRDGSGIPVGEKDSSKRMPWTSIGANWFGIILLAISIGIAFWMYQDK